MLRTVFQVESLTTLVHRMLDEQRDSTPVPVGRDWKGKGKEVEFSDVEILDGPPSVEVGPR